MPRTEQERREQRDPRRETLPDPTGPITFGDGGNSIVVGTQPKLKSFEREFRSRIESSSSNDVPQGCGATFQSQENCEARARTLERLSRLVQGRNDRRASARYDNETRCDFPFEVRGGTAYSEFEGSPSVPSNRAIASTVTTSTTTVAVSALGGTKRGEEDGKGSEEPEEERAEAEGCEHGPTRNPLKDGESSKRADEFADNDGIQTLRVIILSEQL